MPVSFQETAILVETRRKTDSRQALEPDAGGAAPRPATETVHLHRGEVWGGDFELGPLIGRGGMGAVYAGRQLSLERQVAIKALRGHLCEDEELVARFEQEAKWLARINSPHVIQVHAFGRHKHHHFLVMELVEGEDVGRKLKTGWRPTPDECVALIAQAARGLIAAGEHGIVHRDIKPGNMLLTGRGVLKLTDFGLARLVHGSSAISTTGVVLGTDSYMSPEQCQGRAVDQRSDIYSLGVVFYELLTGQRPFVGETHMEVFCQHIERIPTPPRTLAPEISPEIEAVVLSCLEKDPARRYQSARALLEDLERLMARQQPLAPVRSQRLRLPLLVAAGLVLLAGCWWFLHDRTTSSSAPAAALPTAPSPHFSAPPLPPSQVALTPQGQAEAAQPPLAPERDHGSTGQADADLQRRRQQLTLRAGALLGPSATLLPAGTYYHALASLAAEAAQIPGQESWRETIEHLLQGLPDPEAHPVPPWAAAHGVDAYGLWVRCDLHGYQQRFRWCPPGEFLEQDGPAGARRHVRITHGFWLAQTEVTIAQWLAVRQEQGTPSPLPVTGVTYLQAAAFCDTLRSMGPRARLPTEAEWELACQAGHAWTVPEIRAAAWTSENSTETHEVGTRRDGQNAWGLQDMFGNAAEWCSDWYAPWDGTLAVDPAGPPSGTDRCFHGGDISVPPQECLPVMRNHAGPTSHLDHLGLRVLIDDP